MTEYRSLRRTAYFAAVVAVLSLAVNSDAQTPASGALADGDRLLASGGADNLRKAVAAYQAALGDGTSAQESVRAHFGLGRAFDAISDKRQALAHYQAALPAFRTAGDCPREASTLAFIGLDQDYLGQRDAARLSAVQSVEQARVCGDRQTLANSLMYAGQVFHDLGDREQTRTYTEEALALQRETGNHRGEATALGTLGLSRLATSEYPKAAEYFEASIALYHSAGALRDEANSLVSLGVVYRAQGLYDKALDAFERSVPMWSAVGDLSGKSVTLHNIASVYELRGEPQKAIDGYMQAIDAHRVAGYRIGEATSLTNLARVYQAVGDNDRALDTFRTALAAHRATKNRTAEAVVLDGLCRIHATRHEPREAIPLCEQAIAISRELKDRANEAYTTDLLGGVWRQLRDFPKATENAKRALDVFTEIGVGRGRAEALGSLGAVHYDDGDRVQALGEFGQSLELWRENGDVAGQASALYQLARCERSLGKLDDAREHIAASLALTEPVRGRLRNAELRSTFFASVRDTYELQAGILMALGDTAGAFDASERSRSRSLLDTLARGGVPQGTVQDADVPAKLRSIRRQLNRAALRRRETGGSPEIDRRIRALLNEEYDLEGAATQAEPLSLATVQSLVLDNETTLFHYLLGAEESFLWVIDRDRVASYRLAGREEIEGAARKFAALTQHDDSASQSGAAKAGERLGALILEPAVRTGWKKRIAIEADGALLLVPFGALPVAGRGGSVTLLSQAEIVNLPSASTLPFLRANHPSRGGGRPRLLVMADPVFRPGDSRIAVTRGDDSDGHPATDELERSGGASFARLPATRREAESIMAMTEPGQAVARFDFEAGRSVLSESDIAGYDIIHLATHSVIDDSHPELSGIVLSLVDRNGAKQDGFLRLHDIHNLRLNASLVVLSACETALGKEIRGEGLSALSRGFMHAGVPRVVASLWKVDDEATGELMKLFYARLLDWKKPGQATTPAAALRAAQLELSSRKRWHSPYYWAAFVLEGDWR